MSVLPYDALLISMVTGGAIREGESAHAFFSTYSMIAQAGAAEPGFEVLSRVSSPWCK
jgi:hypothetical protein